MSPRSRINDPVSTNFQGERGSHRQENAIILFPTATQAHLLHIRGQGVDHGHSGSFRECGACNPNSNFSVKWALQHKVPVFTSLGTYFVGDTLWLLSPTGSALGLIGLGKFICQGGRFETYRTWMLASFHHQQPITCTGHQLAPSTVQGTVTDLGPSGRLRSSRCGRKQHPAEHCKSAAAAVGVPAAEAPAAVVAVAEQPACCMEQRAPCLHLQTPRQPQRTLTRNLRLGYCSTSNIQCKPAFCVRICT